MVVRKTSATTATGCHLPYRSARHNLPGLLEIAFNVGARCKACGLETTLDDVTGRVIARGETTYMVKGDKPCSCGADVFCVTFAVDLAEESPPQSR